MKKITILQFLLICFILPIQASNKLAIKTLIDIMSATAEMWPTGSSNMPKRKIALAISINILGNYTGSIGQGMTYYFIVKE